jgi:hypothetical protein
MAETVAKAVAEKLPTIKYQIYTSTTDDEVKDDAIARVDIVWSELDMVVASSSIEAGVSYEGRRFDKVGQAALKQPGRSAICCPTCRGTCRVVVPVVVQAASSR